MSRVYTKPGDVFYVDLGDYKKYFQYITNDLTQLNSDVIRVFKKPYLIDETPDLSEIIKDNVELYIHCVINLGLKMDFWKKVGSIKDIGNIQNILFRTAADYGHKAGEQPIKVSSKWRIWNINDKDFTRIGKLEGNYKDAHIGLVMNPKGVIELIKGNKYPINYPD